VKGREKRLEIEKYDHITTYVYKYIYELSILFIQKIIANK